MEEKGFEDFLSSGRTGRRNAMHDISDEKAASVTTAQLPLDMAKLSCAGRLYIPELSCAGRLTCTFLNCPVLVGCTLLTCPVLVGCTWPTHPVLMDCTWLSCPVLVGCTGPSFSVPIGFYVSMAVPQCANRFYMGNFSVLIGFTWAASLC